MPMQEDMSQEEVRKLLGREREPAMSLDKPKPGDGSRYGKRHVRGDMNKTETEYALMLEARRRDGKIAGWEFELEPLKLGKRCSYLPDFKVRHLDGSVEYVDVKVEAAIDPKSVVKIKWAAQRFPDCRFVMEKKTKSGGWKRVEFPASI